MRNITWFVQGFSAGNLAAYPNYVISYKDNVNIGTATVTVTGKGNYAGSKKATFTILPNVSGVKAVSVDYSSVKVSWKKVSGVMGYKVYRANSKNGKYTCVKTVKGAGTVSYKDGKLTTGKTYYYKVRAYRTVNGKKVYGGYSAIKNVKIKK